MTLQKNKPSKYIKSFKLPEQMRKQMEFLIQEGFFMNFSDLIRHGINLTIKESHEIMVSEDLKNE